MADLAIRGGTVVAPGGLRRADIHITGGRIEAVGPELAGAAVEIDARGLHVMPAVIDVHLHFNEPGRTEWEGAATGSRALAAGGGALFFDMPLNSTPCTVNEREFARKRAALEAASLTDFGLWGGLIPGGIGEMAGMADSGAVGFKAFMCDSGLPEFPRADDATLFQGMREAARLGLPVAVHAENQEITAALSQGFSARGRTGVRQFLASRPVLAELEAIRRATSIAAATGAKLHIVHISTGRGAALAAEARARGADVEIETCPHYLCFTDDDVERIGAAAKCAPPLRPWRHRWALWEAVLDGTVQIVASDHSPAPPGMKSGDFWRAWGGIAGAQSTLAALLKEGYHERGLPLARIASLLSEEPARRFRIAGKGGIEPGRDADLVLVDLTESWTLESGDLLQRHAISPYIGRSFRGRVRRTLLRGQTIFLDGRVITESRGRFVRPERN